MKRSVLIFLTRYRRWVALACWLLVILLFLAQAAWNIMAERDAAQNRLQNEAGRVAAVSPICWDCTGNSPPFPRTPW